MVDVLTDAVEVIRQLPEPVQRQTFAGMLEMPHPLTAIPARTF